MARMFELIPRTDRFLSLMPRVNLFGRFSDDFYFPELYRTEPMFAPAFDIGETEKEYTITGEISGLDAKDLDVTLTDGVLTVKGEKKDQKEDKGEHYHRVERHYGCFERSFRLPANVKAEKAQATYKDGVLKLVIPKGAASKAKKVEVKGKRPRTRSKKHEKAH